MSVRGSAVNKNQNLTLYITELSPHNHYENNNGCLSRPYLGKYKRD